MANTTWFMWFTSFAFTPPCRLPISAPSCPNVWEPGWRQFLHLARMKFLFWIQVDSVSKQKNICVFCVLCDSFVSNCFSGVMRFCFVFFVMTQQWRNFRFFPMKLTAVQITPSSAKRRCGVGAVPGASSGVSVVVFRCCFFFNTLSQMLHVGNTYLHLA